jgi:glycosyltransferase involved in cell wall biosynthesis
VLIGAGDIDLDGLPVEVRTWTAATEVADIQAIDVGMMPLPDNHWERGKCGYKLIQYMACGKPVVASPVGVNTEIVQDGVNGFLADDPTAWVNALKKLQADQSLQQRMGAASRKIVEERYSLQVTAPTLSALLHSVGRKES